MKIYDTKDKLILDVDVDDSSYRHRVIKGEHNLTLKYSLAEHVELPVGAYCLFQNERYALERPESFKMKHSRNFEYTVIMEAYQAKAKIWKFRNPMDGRLKFSLTAKPIEHLKMFVDNMNRRDKGWTVGECIDGIEQLISYDHNFCWDALGKMASEFKTEFEIIGKRVSLRKVEYNKSNPLPLAYGRGNGFKPGLGRSNSSNTPPVEILYVQGGTQNIDRSKYGNGELLLPKGQTISYDGEHFEGEAGFNAVNSRRYIVDDLGYSIRRTDKTLSSLTEDSLDCTSIYPKRIGTISSVTTEDATKNFYDIIDNSIPAALNYEECLIPGERMTVIFQSGMLAGREFEVKYYHNAKTVKGKQKEARRFEIVPQEIDGVTMPNATFLPRVGDTYAVFKVMLPQAYICDNATKTGAEWELFKTAVKYMFDNEEQLFTFTGELDGIWAKNDWENIGGRIVLGGYILFHDDRFQKDGVLLRITGIKDYINKPHSPVIEVSNKTVGTGFSSEIKKLQSNEVLLEEKHKEALQFAKRRFRDAQETMEMLEAAMHENFTKSISPATIQTMAMLVGDESLQFRFVDKRKNPVAINHKIIFDTTAKQLKADAGLLQHLTLGIKSISASHSTDEYKFWTVNAYTSAKLNEPAKKYFLYVKAPKDGSTATFLLSETVKGMMEEESAYHFLVGILNSEYEGERSFAPLYGFTEILPGRITTDKIISSNGNSYFDMAANAMKLGNALDFNSRGDGQLLLRGTLVQNEGGATSPLPCYRGEWNANVTYYHGDEVRHTADDGTVTTYRYVAEQPAAGKPISDSLYWSVAAAGIKGDKGTPGAAGKDGRDGLNYVANLLDGTAFEDLGAWGLENNGGSIDPSRQSPVPGTHAVQILCPKGAYAGMSQLITSRLLPSTTYTLSVYSIATAAGAGELMIYPTPARALRVNVTTQWTRHYFTFTTPSEFSAGWVRCFLRLYFKKDAPDNVVYFAAPKLEVGEVPTEWCPSELDRKGTPGKDGINGKDGKPGAKGDKGDPGPKGDKGSPGKDGRDGLNYAANLLDGTAFEDLGAWGLENNGGSIDPSRQSPVPGTHAVQILCPKGAYAGMSQLITARLLPSTTYTLSVYSIATTAGAGELMIYPTPARALRVNVTTQWTRHYFTFTTPSEFSAGWVRCFLRLYFKKDAPDNVVYFAAPKLEVGEAPTEWCPSELDRKGTPGKDGRDGLTPLPNLLDDTAFADLKQTSWRINIEGTGGNVGSLNDLLAVPVTGCSVIRGQLPKGTKKGDYAELIQKLGRLIPGKKYTLSVHAKGTDNAWLIIYPNPGTHYQAVGLKPNEWTRVSVTFTVQNNNKESFVFLRVWHNENKPLTNPVYVDFCAPKLEEGDTVTPWCMSENDKIPDYTVFRFAMNGSNSQPPQLDTTAVEPQGWTLVQPAVAVGQYLWMTSTRINGTGTIIRYPWSTPVRITPTEGRDGAAPAMVYRGTWKADTDYYGTIHRRDAVFYNGQYYIARTDAGTFHGTIPTDQSKWNHFGATFESVATQLLLAEHANIGNWFLSQGKIVSTLEGANKIVLDAQSNEISMHTEHGGGKSSDIMFDASQGRIAIHTRDVENNELNAASLSGDGLFSNNAGTRCWPAYSGIEQYASICGYGVANLDRPNFYIGKEFDTHAVIGVFGRASNAGTAPAYGGLFYNLKACGFIQSVKKVGDSTEQDVELIATNTRIIGIAQRNTETNVHLPADAVEGQTIVFSQIGKGSMLITQPKNNGEKHRLLRHDGIVRTEWRVLYGESKRLTLIEGMNLGEEHNLKIWIVEEKE